MNTEINIADLLGAPGLREESGRGCPFIPGPDREITGDLAFYLAKAAGVPTEVKPSDKPGKLIETTTQPVAVWVRNNQVVVYTQA